jgi:hypothetical protein
VQTVRTVTEATEAGLLISVSPNYQNNIFPVFTVSPDNCIGNKCVTCLALHLQFIVLPALLKYSGGTLTCVSSEVRFNNLFQSLSPQKMNGLTVLFGFSAVIELEAVSRLTETESCKSERERRIKL